MRRHFRRDRSLQGPMIETRALGRTGVRVSALGFGAAPLGDLYARLDDATAIATVETASDAGITLFDTSPHYGNGLSELRVGAGLRRRPRDAVVLSTKVGRVMDPRRRPDPPPAGVISPGFAGGVPHRASFDYSYDGALRAFEQSLLRMGVDRIDVLLIHDVDVWTHGPGAFETRFREAMDGAYRALDRLRSEGAIKAIGVGVNEADVCARFVEAGDFDTVLMAGRYSLLEQGGAERFLPLALRKGTGVMLGGVFNSGILATGPIEGARYNYRAAPPEILARVRRIEAVCLSHGVALADAALRFPLGHPAVASVVIGAIDAGEVARNVASLARPIPAGLWSDLKSERLLAADVPTP
jgi:D-threo-aldose 1-dehydrogenase